MAWPAINRAFSQEPFRAYVESLTWSRWRPSGITWHNTAAPSIAQWMNHSDQKRIDSLIHYWRNIRGWRGCPHLVVSPREQIWVLNPLTEPGVHSPSFNSTHIGIEMVADFEREDDESGLGAKVKRDTIFATAVLCDALGLDPASAIALHKDDPNTTHDCPGENIARDKAEMVQEAAALMAGGEHGCDDMAEALGDKPRKPAPERQIVVTASILNFRRGPGIRHDTIGNGLPRNTVLTVIGAATDWLHVRTPMGFEGWVAGRYTREKT